MLVLPASGDFTNDPTPLFDWTPSSGDVVSYRLQVLTADTPFTAPFDIDVPITGDPPATQFTVPASLALSDRRYGWRVIAADLIPTTATSDARTFTVDTLSPTKPPLLRRETTGDAADNVTSKFKWNASTDPTPDPALAGDESGVFLYQVVVTRIVGNKVVQSGDVLQSDCVGGVCEFPLPFRLAAGQY